MAIHLADGRDAVVNAVDISQWVREIELTATASSIDMTATQDANKVMFRGKPQYTARLTVLSDDDAAAVNATLDAIFASPTPVACTFKPNTANTTAYAGNWQLTEWTPIPGGTGDDAADSVAVFESAGAITRTA